MMEIKIKITKFYFILNMKNQKFPIFFIIIIIFNFNFFIFIY